MVLSVLTTQFLEGLPDQWLWLCRGDHGLGVGSLQLAGNLWRGVRRIHGSDRDACQGGTGDEKRVSRNIGQHDSLKWGRRAIACWGLYDIRRSQEPDYATFLPCSHIIFERICPLHFPPGFSPGTSGVTVVCSPKYHSSGVPSFAIPPLSEPIETGRLRKKSWSFGESRSVQRTRWWKAQPLWHNLRLQLNLFDLVHTGHEHCSHSD